GMVYFILTAGLDYFPMVVTRIFKGMDSFIFICVPLYILAGDLMNATGLTERLVRWSRAVVGKLPGGLAQAQLVATAIFGGISGSALGDIAALGTVFIPNLQKEGYGKDFACALTAASAVADPIIPPSIIIVIYAAVMNTSIGAMYAAAIIPGFLLIFGDMVIVHYLAKKRDYPRRQEPISIKELALGTRDATLALIMPLIILGGIFLGVFTPTEAAAVAAAYALVVGLFIYRKMNFKALPKILYNSAYASGTLFFVIACASILGWAFAMMQVPQQVLSLFSGLKAYPWLILLIMNFFLLWMGMWLDVTANILLFAPIMAPLAYSIGVDPIHFSMIFVMNVNFGNITPPVGIVLFATQAVGKVKMESLVKELLPFLIVKIIIILFVTYIPFFSIWFPKLFGYATGSP
ncbi:MAG: transporter large permease, partial [Deltaproteobacteria bacterium]|nr:transporter large permease [Deltaproteobacteria bacterium]